jgi:hypothetical protein
MTTLEQTIDVAAPLEEAFRYVADFTTVTEWDPGMVQSRRVNNGPVGQGATYDCIASFRGSLVAIRYEISDYEENRRLLLHGKSARSRTIDEVLFTPEDGGTRITYRAHLTLTGLYRLAEPFLRRTFASMGSKAMAGLKARLDAGR